MHILHTNENILTYSHTRKDGTAHEKREAERRQQQSNPKPKATPDENTLKALSVFTCKTFIFFLILQRTCVHARTISTLSRH